MKKITLALLCTVLFNSGLMASGTYEVGTGKTYATFGAAIAAINGGTISGDIVLQIAANSTETSSANSLITLNSSGTGSASYTSILVYPTASGLTIKGTSTTNLTLTLDGADNLTIDGRLRNASGVVQSDNLDMTISGGVILTLKNDACSNTFKYCNIKGYVGGLTGMIVFSTALATTGTGNDNNKFDHNSITNSNSSACRTGIVSTGTATAGKENSGNEFTNNNIYDLISSSNGYLMNLNAGNTGWTIDHNSFYQSTTLTSLASGEYCALYIISGDDYVITNNYFGGSGPLCAGTWTQSTATAQTLTMLNISFGTKNTNGISVQGNTFKNISCTSTGAATTFTAIKLSKAIVNIGNINANTIGGTTGTASINTSSAATGSLVYGIFGTDNTGVYTIQQNTIGDITATNSATLATNVYGVYNNGSSNANISSNTIKYLSSTSASSANAQIVSGIYINGIFSGTGTLSGNIITNLTNSSSLNTSKVEGIYFSANTSTSNPHTISKNFINGFTAVNGAGIYGIEIIAGKSNYYNNIISLGSNNANTIYGINELTPTSSTTKIYYNTIYIGGTPTTGSLNSHALYTSSTITGTRDIRNNIFNNARSNIGATGKHYAAYFNYTANTLLTLNNNDYYVSGIGGVLGYYNSADVISGTTMVTGKDAGSSVTDPAIASPGTTPESYKGLTLLTGDATTGISTDYANNNRSSTPEMGAYELAVWNGSSWSATPTASLNAVINGNYTDAGFNCLDLTINAGKQTTISSGTLSVAGNLLLKSDATNGTATFIDNGGTLSVTGTTNINQYLIGGRNWYISSPVSGSTSAVINATSGNYLWKYNENNTGVTSSPGSALWDLITVSNESLIAMKGYIAKPVSDGIVSFTGTLYTGAQSISLDRTASDPKTTGFNLVGNPYPSYLDWEAATKTNLLTTMWYRSRNSGNTAYVFDTYNGTSHVGTSLNGTAVTQYIPPMQAFWVRVASGSGTSAGSLAVSNTMRSHESGTNRMKAPAVNNQQLLRLQVSNELNSDETIILFNSNASDGFDDYDSPKRTNSNASIPEIYTLADGEQLVINGLSSIMSNKEIPLGFNTGMSNNFTIKATEINNFDADTHIFLRDNILNTEQDITDGSAYNFSSDIVNNTTRFSLVFHAPSTSTGVNVVEKTNAQVFVNPANQITIIAPLNSNYAIYNALGQKMSVGLIDSNRVIVNKQFEAGIYVVKVSENGRNFSTKVAVK